MIDGKLTFNYFDNWLISIFLKQKYINSHKFQLLACEDFVLLLFFCDGKLNIFGFWTFRWTNETVGDITTEYGNWSIYCYIKQSLADNHLQTNSIGVNFFLKKVNFVVDIVCQIYWEEWCNKKQNKQISTRHFCLCYTQNSHISIFIWCYLHFVIINRLGWIPDSILVAR